MNVIRFLCGLFAVICIACQANAQTFAPISNAQDIAELQAGEKDKCKQPDKDKKQPEKKLTDAPEPDLFTRTPMPLQDALGFNPNMLGDQQAKYSLQTVTVIATQTVTSITTIQPIDLPGRTTRTTTTTQVPVTRVA